MSDELKILDNIPDPIAAPREGVDGLAVDASAAEAFDVNVFMARLEAMPGRERIKYASVALSSNLVDCTFLRYFENVVGITLAGKHLVSLAGVRSAPRLSNLSLRSGKTNRIDLTELAGLSVGTLRIERPRPVDVETVGRCTHIRDLNLSHQTIDFRLLASMQLRELALSHARNEEIASPDTIERIEKLNLSHCAALRRFTGPSTKVKTLSIDACNSLEFESLTMTTGLKALRVAMCKQPFDVAVLASLPELEHVTFANSKLVLDGIEGMRMPKLRKLWVSPAKDDVVRRISRAFPAAMVCNGRVLEIGGVRQTGIQRFYEG